MLLRMLSKPRLLLSLAVFMVVMLLFWYARGALTPFIIGLVLAYLLLPLVNRVEALMPLQIKERRLARPLAIVIVYLLVIGVLTLTVTALLRPLVTQISAFIASIPVLYREATTLVGEALERYHAVIPPEVQVQIEERLRGYNPITLLDPILTGGLIAINTVGNTISYIFGLVVIPFWLFFILNDQGKVINGALSMVPRDVRPDVEAVRIIVDSVLSSYIRGQLLVAVALGTVISVGLFLIGVNYSLLLGIAAGALALFPFIGAVLGAIPAVVVAFLQEPILGLYTVLLFLIVQQIDNAFFSPKIIGEAVALHPAVIMVVIVVGSAQFGVVGALVAVPLTAVVRDVVHYIYIRVGEEPMTPVDTLIRLGYGNSLTPYVLEDRSPLVIGAAS